MWDVKKLSDELFSVHLVRLIPANVKWQLIVFDLGLLLSIQQSQLISESSVVYVGAK